jgi:hypothetical protein
MKLWRRCEVKLFNCKREATRLVAITTARRTHRILVCEYCERAIRESGTATVNLVIDLKLHDKSLTKELLAP